MQLTATEILHGVVPWISLQYESWSHHLLWLRGQFDWLNVYVQPEARPYI